MPKILAITLDSNDAQAAKWLEPTLRHLAPVAIQTLSAGDVWLECDDNCLLIIERKTPSDFLASIADKRLFAQAAAMRDLSVWSYVVITGQLAWGLDDKLQAFPGWHKNAIQGALLQVQELGVKIIFASGDLDFVRQVQWLGERERGNVTIQMADRLSVLASAGERILSQFDGLGPERAAALIQQAGSPAIALAWLTWLNQEDCESLTLPGLKDWQKIQALKLKAKSDLGLGKDEQLMLGLREDKP